MENSAVTTLPQNGVPTVAVLLSCYNGEKYLAEQIDSLLCQEGVHVEVYARNDGSKDGTAQILASYASSCFHVLEDSNNVGVAASFVRCLEEAAPHASWFAFCDQDDVWHKDKLARAVAKLEKVPDQSTPNLYCSEYYYCDEALNRVAKSQLNRKGVSFELSLYETICSGNTQVFNAPLARLMLKAPASQMGLHDAWSTLIAAGMGTVIFDDYASLEYRRIQAAVSPSGKNGLSLFKERVRRFLMGDGLEKIKRQNLAFYQCYKNDLPADKRKLLKAFCQGNGLRKAFYPTRLRQTVTDDLALRPLLLIGKL